MEKDKKARAEKRADAATFDLNMHLRFNPPLELVTVEPDAGWDLVFRDDTVVKVADVSNRSAFRRAMASALVKWQEPPAYREYPWSRFVNLFIDAARAERDWRAEATRASADAPRPGRGAAG